VIALVEVIVPYGGLYHTHIRNEGDDLLDAIREAITICETTGARTNISHFKAVGEANWGSVKEAAGLIEEARARGLEITADQYPYPYTNNNPYMTLIPRQVWLGDKSNEVLQPSDLEVVFDHLRDDELVELYNKSSVDPLISEQVPQYLDNLPRKELVSLVARSVVNTSGMQGAANPRERALFIERMNHPAEAQWVREEVRKYVTNGVSPKHIMIGVCPVRELEGKSLQEAATVMGKSVEDTAIELGLMNTLAVAHRMSEEDIEYIMTKDYVATGSDGAGPPMGIGNVHSRSYTTFLNKIKKYAQERKAISVAHAVRSQTSLPAEIMSWNDRGWIKEGYAADVAVIDLGNIETRSDISRPHEYSEGVEYLLINGDVVIDKGEFTGKLPGKILKLKK
jgi:N-acyl-D-aspartate/D-glutamate deacylase